MSFMGHSNPLAYRVQFSQIPGGPTSKVSPEIYLGKRTTSRYLLAELRYRG